MKAMGITMMVTNGAIAVAGVAVGSPLAVAFNGLVAALIGLTLWLDRH